MADVFISYAREDKARAEQVARGLGALGLDVFWDSEIPPGQTWADYIEEKLSSCKAVVVLWSTHSTRSQWVREEARMGRDKGRLIPAMIDASQAPFGFGEVQAANLAEWTGGADHPEWRRFSEAVRAAASGAAAPEIERRAQAAAAAAAHTRQAPRSEPAPAAAKKSGIPVWGWVAGAVIGTVVVLGVIGSMLPGQQAAAPATDMQSVMQTPDASAPPAQTPAAPASGGTPQEIILQQLQQAEQAFRQQGFQQFGAPVSGGLAQSQQQAWPVTLQAGIDYRIIGVCDRDCADLDLALYDQAGNLINQDASADDHPVVQSQPAWNGPFTVQVTMYNCTQAPCYYALVLYARPVS
jgi:TIR domain